jgi:hypothetical protein
MAVCSELEPKEVFAFFEEIAGIPRPSHHEEKISAYLQRFAKERGLEHYTDEKHNVIIIKEASAGYENEPPIILQGHMDMVTEKTADCQKDMTKEGLDLYIDGDWLRAKGTTLGADDGIALAYALALLDSPTLKHPRLEFICTVSEETDMGGAHAVDVSMLKGNRMLNLDSDEEGIALAGCAGGGDADITLPVRRAAVRGEHIRLAATGLTGGHSGMEIGKGRASAALLLARVLTGLREDYAFRLVSLEGGAKYNAITREASAEVVLADSVSTSAFREAVKAEEAVLRREYAATDPSLSLTAAIADSEAAALTEESTKQVLGLMEALPYGVQRMSADIDGLVETSVNLGITKLEADKLTLSYSVRSSIATAFQAVIDKLELVSSCFGATALVHSTYPAWEYVRESAFRDEAAAIYRELFGKELSVQAIHAGLECGILSGKIKDLDAVSIGPDMKDIHTPEERLNIPSTKRVYDFVVKIIEHKSK